MKSELQRQPQTNGNESPYSIAAASAMPARSAAMLIVFAMSRAITNDKQKPFRKSLFEITGQALACNLANSGAHHLNRSHQRPCQQRSP